MVFIIVKEYIGIYQKLTTLGLLIPGIAAFSLISLIPYMIIKPKMLCANENNEFYTCPIELACNTPYSVKVDDQSISNWIVDFKLHCKSDNELEIFLWLFLMGISFGVTFLVPLADYFGITLFMWCLC